MQKNERNKNMGENTRVVREQKRLETSMNIPPVDDNLYIHTLRGRNIPYDTWQKQFSRQNYRGKEKPDIPPRQSSLQMTK